MQPTYHSETTERIDLLVRAAAVVGDRWSLPIVGALLAGPRRYTEIRDRLPGIAPNILTARLRSLEEEGLVSAERYSERPPRYEYRLTGDGEGLADASRLLAAWANHRAGGEAEQAVHDACGTPLELRWWCPTCAMTPGAEGEDSAIV
jgi:DNA-binding HxlR family transcriptional regulator